MKKFNLITVSIIAILCIVFTCCSSDSASEESALASVKLHVNGFSISQEAIGTTRAATAVADYAGVKAITVAFYDAGGTLKYSATQLRADATTYTTFGDFSLSLPYGSYTMQVMGYGSEYPVTLNSKTSVSFGEEKSRETFVYTQEVEVEDATPLNLNATLNRIVTRLSLQSTDGRPANATQIRVTFEKGGKGFNPMTGRATSDAGFVNLLVPTTAVDATTNSLTNFFLVSDEETMDITIETLDAADNVLFSKTVENVPFKRNRATILRGSIYSSASSASFSLETTFLDDHTVNF